MKEFNILLLPGDGIGPEVTAQAELVLQHIAEIHKFNLRLKHGLIGGAAIDEHNDPCPQETLAVAEESDGILLGAVGGPKWDGLPLNERPEKGLLRIRSELGFFANYRPAKVYASLANASPLRSELTKDVDILILRELTGGLYFGEPRGRDTSADAVEDTFAYNTLRYSRKEIERLVTLAFTAAKQRDNRLCSVDKANVLETSVLWREVVNELAKDHPEVTVSHLYVDNAAMQLVRAPASFDVIVTENLFGDILSDLAAQLVGSIGILPSASLRKDSKGLYEPVHGSAPDIAGKNQANPLAAILSAAMMLRYSLQLDEAADHIEAAVTKTLDSGIRSADLLDQDGDSNKQPIGCKELAEAVINNL
ncbi:MAG: 3-isopropylmalate dehydrogenase [Candidatus Portiera sp.]|nr:3-isopropylmalate dehydrogenase [Portiera sp.]